MNPMLEAALSYLARGWSVIPLRPREKTPLVASWRQYQTERADRNLVNSWWSQYPEANVGIVTGAISGLVVVDLDGPEGIASGDTLKLASTVAVATGKGKHLYYAHPGEAVCNAVRKFPGVDIRADGGYVLGPPSVHPNGAIYNWTSANALNVSVLPSLPTSIAQSTETTRVNPNRTGWISEALSSLEDGNRNDTFTRIVGRLHRDKYSAGDIRDLLIYPAKACGFPSDELDSIIGSVTRYKDADRLLENSGGYQRPSPLRIYSPANDYDAVFAGANDQVGLSTGFRNIDGLIGSLRNGELFTVAARTGVGKTNLGLGIAFSLCRSGKRVLYFSTEMSVKSIWERVIALSSFHNTDFKSANFLVCDEFTPDLKRLEDAIQEIKPDLFVFDHINNIGDDYESLSMFMRGLKEIAAKLKLPGVVVAQLNRSADFIDMKTGNKITPRLSMIKGSGVIEEVSAQVLLLQEMRATEDQTDVIGVLDKNRYGEKGILSFALKKKPYRMEEA